MKGGEDNESCGYSRSLWFREKYLVRVMQGTDNDAEIAALPKVLTLLIEEERREQRETCLRCGAAQ